MIASLGMYDRPEVQGANDRLWVLMRDRMRAHGLSAPDALTRGPGAYWAAWTAPDLTLSQTCGFPYRTTLHDRVTLIATPDYGVTGCPPGYYRSVLIARADDPRHTLPQFDTAPLAFNEDQSHSGWAAPQTHAAHLGITLPPRLRSGSHIQSARAVADGRADIAAIDDVTWDMITQWDPFAAHLKVVGTTDPTPGLPYIAAPGTDPDALYTLLAAAIAALPAPDRQILRLKGLVRIHTATYRAIPIPATPSDLGLPLPDPDHSP